MGRVLIAGIGNLFLGDDGFGVAVAHRLERYALGEDVNVAVIEGRGIRLAWELAGGSYDAAILVDATARGGEPGTLYVIEPDDEPAPEGDPDLDADGVTPANVLAWLRRMGAPAIPVVVIGCEPHTIGETVGLSKPVAAAVRGAIAMVREQLDRLRASAPGARQSSAPSAGRSIRS
jgi:hydrogenase maturation protease